MDRLVTELSIFGTIAGATTAWALGELLRSRVLWSAGAVLAVLHTAAAFHVVHGWSHQAAAQATAQQTEALTGIGWSGGVFFNYAFLATWIGDSLWWWVSQDTYERRPGVLSAVIRAFLGFMFLNGAVVFADGGMRVLGILAVGAVSIAWFMKFFRQTVRAR